MPFHNLNTQRPVYLAAVLLCLNIFALAQYRIDNWTTEHGLPQNSVRGLVQSSDGYIWGVTSGGIFRFDGVRFKTFNKSNTNGLRESRFRRIIEDAAGRIWFETELSTLIRYENREFTTFKNGDGYSGSTRVLLLDSDGRLVVTTDKGSFRYENGRFSDYEVENKEKGDCLCLIDRSGGKWLWGETGLRRVLNEKIERFDLPLKPSEGGVLLFEDSSGSVWFSRLGKTFRIRGSAIEKIDGLEGETRLRFREDSEQNLWITLDDELVKINASDVRAEKTDFSQAQKVISDKDSFDTIIGSLEFDREGGLWVGTGTRGLFQLTPQTVNMKTASDWATKDDNIYPILEDSSGGVWFGVWLDGLFKYGENKQFQSYRLPPDDPYIGSLFEDSKGRILVGTLKSLKQFENGEFKEIPVEVAGISEFQISAITEGGDNNLWLATHHGLLKYAGAKTELFSIEEGLPSKSVSTLLWTKDGKLWIGTRGGLAVYENGKIRSFIDQDELDEDHIRSLYEDSDGTLWIGTYDTGLIQYKDGVFRRITKENGLFNENVFCTLEDEGGWFWINTNNGIFRVRKQQLNDFFDGNVSAVDSIGYTKKDGLQNTEGNGGKQPAGIKRRNGEFWFPTQNGIAIVNPNDIPVNPVPPPVYIEEIAVDKKDIGKFGELVEIQPDHGDLEISYTGLSFVNSSLVRFRYRLEGLEENWNEVGSRRTAFYNNLPPGEYTFHVLAANRDGVWNSVGASVKIVKYPHFYQTWWFWIFCALAIGGIIYWIVQNRISNLRRIADLRGRFSRRLIESQEAERKRIAADLHDGLGQELVLIKNRAELGLRKGDEKETSFKQLEDISDTASQLLDEVREITSDLRPQLLDKLGLTKAIKAMLRKVSALVEVESRLDNIDDLFSEEDEINIYRIVQESINNAVKHSNASTLTVEIKRRANEVKLYIADDGRGFETDETGDQGFGLIGLKERASLLGGKFSIDSRLEEGTRIAVEILID